VPKGRLGATKVVDTDSFFADFDKPDEPAAPTAQAVAAVTASGGSGGSGATSSLYAYSDPGLLAKAAAEQQEPFGMTKPKGAARGAGMVMGAIPTAAAAPTSSRYTAGGDSDYAQRKFAAAKAISSDQFFEEERPKPAYDADKEARLSRFTGSRAISSADYFERDESGMGEVSAAEVARRIASTASSDLSTLREAVVDKTRQLATAAQQWLNEMQQS
jgi:ADP-ribosylation factor GTPase-activating protein 2/3